MLNFHVFNARTEYESAFRVPLSRNRFLVLGVAAALGLHVLSMHLPLMQTILQIAPVDLHERRVPVLIAATIVLVMEVFKIVRRRAAAR